MPCWQSVCGVGQFWCVWPRAIGLGRARTETRNHSSAPREVKALDALFILISILTLCLYNVLIKKFPNKFILFFLVNVFSYLGFLGIYFFRVFVLQHDLGALHELIMNYTYQNVPLYVLIAFAFLGYMIVSEQLLNGYDVSLVIPIAQFGMLLASAGYIALGDPFTPTTLLNAVSREGAFSCARDRPGADAGACLPRTVAPHPHGRLCEARPPPRTSGPARP